MTPPAPQAEMALQFLRDHYPEDRWVLTAIDPKQKGRIVTRTFNAARSAAAAQFVTEQNGKKWNVYFALSPPDHDLQRKANKDQIPRARFIWADLDPRKGKPIAKERDRLLQLLRTTSPPPTIIIDSGRGFWGLYALSVPVDFDGAQGAATLDFESRMRGLCKRLDGDASGCEIAKIGRLPGTVNWPDDKKREGGAVEALASVLERSETSYALSDFPLDEERQRVATPVDFLPAEVDDVAPRRIENLDELAEWNVPDNIVSIIAEGHPPDAPPKKGDDSESGWFWHGLGGMVRAGVPDDIILGIVTDDRFGISETILKKGKGGLKSARSQLAKMKRQEAAGGPRDAIRWYECDEDGNPRRSYRNTRAAILALGIVCEHDVFHGRMKVGGHVIAQWAGELSDHACAVLRHIIADRFDFDPGKEHVHEAALELCLENPIDPVVDYLAGLTWDGVARLDAWMVSYLGAKDTALNRAMGRLLLIAAVRRARRPGTKFDFIVVLEGLQGSGKSTALQVLAGPNAFSDQDLLHLEARAQQEAVQGVWIYELGELAGLGRADVEKVKAFASRAYDRARPAYGRHSVDQPRRCVFVGTTNQEQYLRDPTGNRRFWPVRTGVIDLEALKKDRDQLWAEAATAEAGGASLTLAEELWAEAAARQDRAREDDPWMDLLLGVEGDVHGEEERVSSAHLFNDVLAIPVTQQTPAAGRRLADCMRRLGWRDVKHRVGGKSRRGYRREAPAERLEQGDLSLQGDRERNAGTWQPGDPY